MKKLFIDKLPDEVYYELLKLKAEWKCDTWREFLKEVLARVDNVVKVS